MSYLTLLFTSATQGMRNTMGRSRQVETETYLGADEARNTFNGSGVGSDDYRLPSGIASLEHWLDLNA